MLIYCKINIQKDLITPLTLLYYFQVIKSNDIVCQFLGIIKRGVGLSTMKKID